MSTRRRKWPTFRTSFSLCSFLLSLCLFSLYRRRIPSGLLFVIHSINVCCLWDLLLLFFFCNFVSFSYVFNLVLLFWSLPCHFDTHTHTVLFVCVCVIVYLLVGGLLLHMLCDCVQVVVSFASSQHVSVWICPNPCYCATRHALNRYTGLCLFSLTKLSMENKYGSYVLQNIK